MPEAKRRIAIIGCGYVGSAVGEALARTDWDVHGTTTSPTKTAALEARGIVPHVLEVADVTALHDLFSECDHVLLSVAAGRRGRDYRSVYLAGAENVRRAVVGTPVFRIVYTSSTRVYGQDDGSWVDEESPTEPVDDNGRVLLKAERTLLGGDSGNGGAGDPCVSVVRLSGIYGPGRDPSARILQSAGQERSDGDAYVNLIHLDDIVAALVKLLSTRHHGVLNLSDDAPVTRRDYYDRIIADASLPPIRWLRPDGPPHLGKRIRNSRIKQTLGLTMQHYDPIRAAWRKPADKSPDSRSAL